MKKVPFWVRPLLIGGGILNLFLAALFLLMPLGSQQLFFGSAPFLYPQALQFWALLLAVLGLGYLAVGVNPHKNTVVLLMGLLANILFAVLLPVLAGDWLWQYWQLQLWVGLALVWCAVLLASLSAFAQAKQTPQTLSQVQQEPLSKTLMRFRTQRGKSLLQLSNDNPTLVVFLRQLSGPFGNDTLEDIQHQRKAIESRGVQVVLVHLADTAEASTVLEKYELADLHHISDPSGIMYNAFGLDRSKYRRLWSWAGRLPELMASIWSTEAAARVQSDSILMPGVFLISKGEIVRSYKHRYSSERPDYRQMAAGQAA